MLLRQLQHHVARSNDFGGKRRIGAAFEVAIGEAQVAGAVFGEGEAGDGEGFGGSVEGLLVFEFDAEHDLAFGVEGPDVGLLEVLLGVQAPDPGGEGVAAPAAEANAQCVDGLLVDRVAGGLDEALDSLGVAGAGEVDAVDALGQGLLDHPAAGGDGRPRRAPTPNRGEREAPVDRDNPAKRGPNRW